MKLAIVRIKGPVRLRHDFKRTLELLKLDGRNACVIREDSPQMRAMLRKVRHLVTWGEVNEDALAKIEKRKDKRLAHIYHLPPPRKGFGRKGIKLPFTLGGAYGDRKDKINDLLIRMS